MSIKRCTTLTAHWIGNLTAKWKFLPWTHEIPPWRGIPPRLGTTDIRATIKRQQRPNTRPINSCSAGESVKFDIKWVDKRVEDRVAGSCKKAYWWNIPGTPLFIFWLRKQSLKYTCHSLNYSKNKKRPLTASSVPTLKPLLLQYSLYRFTAYIKGHQRGARGHQVIRKDHVSRRRACSKNNISMINVFTLTNINTKMIEGKLSKTFISECISN